MFHSWIEIVCHGVNRCGNAGSLVLVSEISYLRRDSLLIKSLLLRPVI